LGWPAREELSALWLIVRDGYEASAVRDHRYLPFRYPLQPVGPYFIVAVRGNGNLVGLAIVREPRGEGDPRLRGISLVTISEMIYPLSRPDIGAALLLGAEKIGSKLKADCLLVSTSSPPLLRLLSLCNYFRTPANMFFLFRDAAAYGLSTNISGWWLTRGDMNADETF
jgi:hypothetical protein